MQIIIIDVENIVTTVVLYIKQVILYSKTMIPQYLEHRHMNAGLSRSPRRLEPLLKSQGLNIDKTSNLNSLSNLHTQLKTQPTLTLFKNNFVQIFC